MYTLKHNAIETTILHAIPAFPNDRNMLPREVILLAAYDFCEQFVRSVRAYQESNRDERFKPCMKQQQYTEPIYHLLEARHDRPIYHDKNNVYQVLFEAAEMEQMVSDTAAKPRQPAKRKKKTIMLPAAQQLHLHFHGDVENKAVVNIIGSNVTYTDNSRNYTINTVE